MQQTQAGILEEETTLARYLIFAVDSEADITTALQALCDAVSCKKTVIGIGLSLVNALDKQVPGLKNFPALTGQGIDIPSTPAALWCWLRGTDRGELYHRSRHLENILMPGFILQDATDTFQYNENRDLSGYEDGTENPRGDDAIAAAIVNDEQTGMSGSSFVAIQQWLHDFDVFEQMTTAQQDNAIGRRISDNEEMDDAPESAHVKRTAQESFSPEAFMLRRSMPWADGMAAGLYFVAFISSVDVFEVQLKRMLGLEDGISDALFQFTRPVSGAYFWCPPMKNGKLDLGMLGVNSK